MTRKHSIKRIRVTHHGFTLIELMVVMTILGLTIVAASQLFTITSDATVRTDANAQVIQRSRQINERLEDQVGKLANESMLIINCPRPIFGVAENKASLRWPMRWDSLVLVTRGDNDEYESFIDRRRGSFADPMLSPATSSEAIVYFGPGLPLTTDPNSFVTPLTLNDPQLTAQEWMFLHRSILLLLEKRDDIPNGSFDPTVTIPRISDQLAAGGIFNNPTIGTLLGVYRDNSIDVLVSDDNLQASAASVSDIILQKDLFADLLSDNPSIAPLWQPSWAPRTVRVENNFRNARDHYTRSGSNFMPGLADFRIEWTDGGVDTLGADLNPGPDINGDGIRDGTGDEGGTRWFGLRESPGLPADSNMTDAVIDNVTNRLNPTPLPNVAIMRSNPVLFPEGADAYQAVEWSELDSNIGINAAYRAIWRGDTWDLRPKALRFTYRLYDDGNRLKQNTPIDLDRDGDFDPDDNGFPFQPDVTRRELVRFGREFSVVVKLP